MDQTLGNAGQESLPISLFLFLSLGAIIVLWLSLGVNNVFFCVELTTLKLFHIVDPIIQLA